jgi:hypothetical protein
LNKIQKPKAKSQKPKAAEVILQLFFFWGIVKVYCEKKLTLSTQADEKTTQAFCSICSICERRLPAAAGGKLFA